METVPLQKSLKYTLWLPQVTTKECQGGPVGPLAPFRAFSEGAGSLHLASVAAEGLGRTGWQKHLGKVAVCHFPILVMVYDVGGQLV